MDKFINDFLLESIEIIKKIDQQSVLRVVRNLLSIKQAKGRIFLCGSGGGA